jgi:DNA-binding GntR family transcriptional regulator
LEQEGFVERIPNVGYYVRKINLQEIEDLFDLRMILELYAVEMAIRNQTPEDIRLLEELQQNHKNYNIQIYDRRKLILDAAFHSQIAALSRNQEIVKELRRIFEHTYLRSPVERIPPVRLPIAAAQHQEILQRIRERDVTGARESLERHIREAKEARRAMLAALPSMEMSAASM